jgi:serine O-acetyltransferase
MKRESLVSQIRADWRACFERDPAARHWLEVLLAYPGFHAILAHRILHRVHRAGLPVVARVGAHVVRFLTGIEIHPAAEIGAGFFIDHGMGVVIGETTEIRRNCTLYQGVTLGGTSLQRGKRHPTLEDNVVVGAGAAILGAIVIGANTKVAAGAVVVKSAPPNSTVVGVPGRVVFVDGKRVPSPVVPQVDMPDPTSEALTALSKRVAELEARLREVEGSRGTPTL